MYLFDVPATTGLILSMVGIAVTLLATTISYHQMRNDIASSYNQIRNDISSETEGTRAALDDVQHKLQADSAMALEQLSQRIAALRAETIVRGEKE